MNTVDVLVGKRIRARRTALGLTQAELGQAIGVRFQQVQKYETGANRVSASRLWAIAEFLDVDVVFFFDGIVADTPGSQEPRDAIPHRSDPETLELVDLYSVLPREQKKAVLAIIRSMSSRDSEIQTSTLAP